MNADGAQMCRGEKFFARRWDSLIRLIAHIRRLGLGVKSVDALHFRCGSIYYFGFEVVDKIEHGL